MSFSSCDITPLTLSFHGFGLLSMFSSGVAKVAL
jgi:hypothetical protein